jgi:hypothetical protein
MDKMTHAFGLACSAALLAIPVSASAQSSGDAMLAPGVHTTADISARCQQYAQQRVRGDGAADRSRQAVFVACVRHLSARHDGEVRQAGPALVEAPVAATPMIGAAVAMPPAAYEPAYSNFYDPTIYLCRTDEGYGRLGNCSPGTY